MPAPRRSHAWVAYEQRRFTDFEIVTGRAKLVPTRKQRSHGTAKVGIAIENVR
jgi:hypothetical protein